MYKFRDNYDKKKSCVVSRSFGKRVEKFQELKEAVVSYCLNASEKIRSESLVTKQLQCLSELVLFKEILVITPIQKR